MQTPLDQQMLFVAVEGDPNAVAIIQQLIQSRTGKAGFDVAILKTEVGDDLTAQYLGAAMVLAGYDSSVHIVAVIDPTNYGIKTGKSWGGVEASGWWFDKAHQAYYVNPPEKVDANFWRGTAGSILAKANKRRRSSPQDNLHHSHLQRQDRVIDRYLPVRG